MSQTPNGGNTRIEYLDYLRGVLMALGVVYHVACVYLEGGGWRISDANAHSAFFNWLVAAVHLFRMPSFFILSGFLFSVSATRHGVVPTFVKRASRISIPLVVVLVVFNSLEVLICQNYRYAQGLPSLSFWNLEQNSWIGHLWFLVYLLGFHCFAVIVGVIRDRTGMIPATASDSLARYIVYVPLVAGVYEIAIRGAAKFVPIMSTHALNLSTLDWLLYLPFYVVGVIAGTNRVVGAELSKFKPQHAVMLVASGTTMIQNPFEGLASVVADRLAHIVFMWVCCIFCFCLFERLCRAGGAVLTYVRKFSEASYTIYLFHHLTVIMLGLLLLNQNWPVWVKFSVVLTAATAFSYALHRLITRVPILLFLFNGVPLAETEKKRGTTVPEPVPQPVLQPAAVLEPITARSVAAAAAFGRGVTSTYATSTPRASAARNGL